MKLYKSYQLSIFALFLTLSFAFSLASANESFITLLGETIEKSSFSRCKLPDTSFAVRIDSRRCTYSDNPNTISVPVSLKSPPYVIWGFDFTIAYDSSVLYLESVQEGSEFYSDSGCAWEYFRYRREQSVNCGSSVCQNGLVRIFGIADVNSVEGSPECWNPGKVADLFYLNFRLKNDNPDLYVRTPIQFFWSDCRDNLIAYKFNDDGYGQQTVRLARTGRIFTGDSELAVTDTFPSFNGPADSCFNDSNWPYYHPARKIIDFHNGWININPFCDPTILADINLNGYPYEVQDAILFAKYFLYGDSAFRINTAGQKEATDINADGEKLKLEDLVQLVRIVLGDLRPDWTFDSTLLGNNIVRNRSDGSAITLENDYCTDLIWLRFRGEINPILPAESTFVISHFDGDDTRVLLLGLKGFAPGSHHLFHYTGTGLMIDAQAATLEGYEIPLTINDAATSIEEQDDILPSVFALYQNYPNPFNIETTIKFDLPNASEVSFEIFNILGQVVYNVSNRYSAGSHTIYWDGSSNSGQTVGSGVYYYRITTADFVSSKKMILLK